MRLLTIELKKIRRRHIGLLYLALLALILAWMSWCLKDMDDVILSQGYYLMLLNLPLMNAILLPTVLAAVCSRICDIEIKGNTFKLLCTLESRQNIYHIKLLINAIYLLLFSLAEAGIILLLGKLFSIQQALPLPQLGTFIFSTFFVSLVLILLQQPLSLLFENQLFPLFLGVGGSFLGLFSWFFPELPLRYLVPWGYYYVSATVTLYYEKTTREVTYYPIAFPIFYFGLFLIFGVIVYFIGKTRFMKKEV